MLVQPLVLFFDEVEQLSVVRRKQPPRLGPLEVVTQVLHPEPTEQKQLNEDVELKTELLLVHWGFLFPCQSFFVIHLRVCGWVLLWRHSPLFVRFWV